MSSYNKKYKYFNICNVIFNNNDIDDKNVMIERILFVIII